MKKLTLLLAAVALGGFAVRAQTIAPFRDGDRAVFLGNSITDGGHYHSYIWLYYMTRFPEMNLRILNAGIGGDTAADMLRRLDGDVFSKKPTVLTVTFGMNDTGYMEYNGDGAREFGERRYRECLDNYRKLEARLKGLADTRVVQMGGSPFDETAQIESAAWRGKNAVMQRVVEFQRESAAANGWEFLDLNAPMTAINVREQATDPTFTLCGGDRVHPDNEGHMVMAYLYLKAQGFAGRVVADVEIDGVKTVKSVNAQVSNVRRNGRDVSFDYLAASLPYPVDTLARGWGAKKSQAAALKVVPFIEEMNRETLTVKGLRGDYKLMIDGEEIGTWSGEEWARGVNLAEQTWTPQYRQAVSVMYLNEYRWELERSFREWVWMQFNILQPKGLLMANDKRAVAAIDKEKVRNGWVNNARDVYSKYMNDEVLRARQDQIEMLTERIYEINKPVTRRITLHRVE